MTFYAKQPQASVDYLIDWGSPLTGRSLVASEWRIEPAEHGGVTVVACPAGPMATRATLTGGVAGRDYRITGRAMFGDGGSSTRSLDLRVETRA